MSGIAFIIRKGERPSEYYHPHVKPFVDMSIGLNEIGSDSIIFLHKDEKHLADRILKMTGRKTRIQIYSDDDFAEIISRNHPDSVIVDDNLKYMRMTLDLLPSSIRKAVYVQYLFGVNTNKKVKRHGSFELLAGSMLPWRFIINGYRKLLLKFDDIIANSQTCRYILTQFYDVPVSGVIYPPVGADIRPFLESGLAATEKKGITIFVGSGINDHFLRYLGHEIALISETIDEPIRLLVSEGKIPEQFNTKHVEVYSRIPVERLIEIVRKSKVTYVPTAYELFGHFGAESVMMGTPALLDTYHPFLENFPIWTEAVTISSPRRSILEECLLIRQKSIQIETARNFIADFYSPERSSESLVNLLEIG